MRPKGLLAVLLLGVFVAAALVVATYPINLSALSEPGRMETYLASQAKRWIIAKSAKGPLPTEPPNDSASMASGKMLFGGVCANCHGLDGVTPTDLGRAMYPRTLSLSSAEAQQWSDAELFWIIKNGIRLSGMPGFGKMQSDAQIWHLVHYVRSLGKPAGR